MSVTITCYSNFKKRRNSTKLPTDTGSTKNVVFKAPTSEDAPVFVLDGIDFTIDYVKWGSNYYFVSDRIIGNNNIFELHCVKDVMGTYAADIVGSTQFVSYSSSKTSNWLADTRIPVSKETLVSANSDGIAHLSNAGCYVLSVIGKNTASLYKCASPLTLKRIIENISTWKATDIQTAINELNVSNPQPWQPYTAQTIASDDLHDLANALSQSFADLGNAMGELVRDMYQYAKDVSVAAEKSAVQTGFLGNAYDNAPQCIRSCIWVPFTYDDGPGIGAAENVFLGDFDTGITLVPISAGCVTHEQSITIPWHYSDWKRAALEDVYLYLPLVGMVNLSADSITNVSSITIKSSITYSDGSISYKVLAGSEVIGAFAGQCSANYPLGIAQQASAGTVSTALIQGVEKTVAGALVGNIGGALIEGASAAYNVLDAINTKHISSVGSFGGGSGVGLGLQAVCFTVAHPLIESESDFASVMGYPTMQAMSLSSLSGYTQCANASVSIAGTDEDRIAVNNFLNSGFFIE